MITSTRNPHIKFARRLLASRRFRQQEFAYVVEGDRWLDEIIKQAIRPRQVFISGGWYESEANQARLKMMGAPWHLIDDQVMVHVSDTETPPGILLVVPMETQPIPERTTLLLILDGVADPGNMGAMLRTAAAAGADAVLLGPGCVDPYNPKVVRASMGAILRLPIARRSWPEIEHETESKEIWLATAGGGTGHAQINWRLPSALIIGSEASGAGDQARRLGRSISIPMADDSESLNAAVAAGIILFEAARQRSETPGS